MEHHILTGRVERDPRSGTTKNNKPFISFTISTRRSWADKVFTSYHNCSAFGDLAKTAQRLGKGDLVQVLANEVKGEIYTPRTGGDPKVSLNYTLRELVILETSGAKPDAEKPASSPPASEKKPATTENLDEDVPF